MHLIVRITLLPKALNGFVQHIGEGLLDYGLLIVGFKLLFGAVEVVFHGVARAR